MQVIPGPEFTYEEHKGPYITDQGNIYLSFRNMKESYHLPRIIDEKNMPIDRQGPINPLVYLLSDWIQASKLGYGAHKLNVVQESKELVGYDGDGDGHIGPDDLFSPEERLHLIRKAEKALGDELTDLIKKTSNEIHKRKLNQ